jgi:N utilization substance protein B
MLDAASEDNAIKNPVNELQKQFDASKELFIYLLYFITEVARYAETDAKHRAGKNLPSAADLNVNTKLTGNELLWQILEGSSFIRNVEQDKPELKIDTDLLKKIYNDLTETEEYKAYIAEQSREKAKEKDIIKFIFTNLMLPNENFIAHIEELFNNWDDDAEMMDQLMLSYLQKPSAYNLSQMMTDEKWQFAKSLLITTFNKKNHLLELIKPKLKNWDADRIATLDMIIMEMGVAEFLYFETIPTKVTINEYIDLAKEYSTPQSGQFVNGILDNIHKELTAEGKIDKVDFKQKSS